MSGRAAGRWASARREAVRRSCGHSLTGDGRRCAYCGAELEPAGELELEAGR